MTFCNQEVIHNLAFVYGYGARLERLRSFLVANPHIDLTSSNLEDMNPDHISQQHLNCIGSQLMLVMNPRCIFSFPIVMIFND